MLLSPLFHFCFKTTSPATSTPTPSETAAVVDNNSNSNSNSNSNTEDATTTTPFATTDPSATTFRDATDDDSDRDQDEEEAALWLEPNPLSPYHEAGTVDSLLVGAAAADVDDDLIAALLSIGLEDDSSSDNEKDPIAKGEDNNKTNILDSDDDDDDYYDDFLTGTPSSLPLPDIELDFAGDTFLIDPEQLERIFDVPTLPDGANLGGSDTSSIFGEEEDIHLVDDPDTAAGIFDQDTDDLYRELANLSLESTAMSLNDDGLPSYLYCQPCTPESALFDLPPVLDPIGEDEPFEHSQLDRPLLAAAHEFQELIRHDPTVATELLQLDTHDALFHQMEAHPDLYPLACEAAGPFIDAFGLVETIEEVEEDGEVEKIAPTPATKQRACYTHRETIFGVTFSDCGTFCATASQDSTVCIWNVATNALLAQLEGHSKAFECLRVAWATPYWAAEVMDRGAHGDSGHLIASSGADGVVKLWACPDPLEQKVNPWKCQYTLDHATLGDRGKSRTGAPETANNESKEDAQGEDKENTEAASEPDKPQTYTLQFIDHWQAFTTGQGSHDCNHNTNANGHQNSFLMTSSDEYIHFWEIETQKRNHSIELVVEENKIRMLPDKVELREVMSLHFASLERYGFGVTLCSITGQGLQLAAPPTDTTNTAESGFGGGRNPNNKVFVFDASYCSANGLLGVALSDGSLRLINGRGICISVLNLPGSESHLTSFCWDSTGTRLASSVATGHLITWNLDLEDLQGQGHTVATCTAIMEGGHQPGRPLFGSRYCGTDEHLIVSWGVDGRLALWDSYSQGNVNAPIAILKADANYPIYACELSKGTIAVGGGNEGGFIGIPLYLYTFGNETRAEHCTIAKSKCSTSNNADEGGT